MNALAARRRHPAAIAILLLLGLVVTGGVYAVAGAQARAGRRRPAADDVAAGKKLFLANCATCHGAQRPGRRKAGPSLAGVGAAAVDFQVGTGRMPLANPGVQAMRKNEQVQRRADRAARRVRRVAGPRARPSRTRQYTSGEGGDIAKGGELFRVNCAMCHNFAGSGGALTRGKYAPTLRNVDGHAHLRGDGHRPAVDAGVQRRQHHPREQAGHHRLPARHRQEREPRRPQPGQPRPGLRGTVRLDLSASALSSRCAVWLGKKAA